MAKTSREAFAEISAYITRQGGSYSDWYCGITSNIEDRLFAHHYVPKKFYWQIARECENSESARAVEKALFDFGCDGGGSRRDEDSIYVYAYLKSSDTVP